MDSPLDILLPYQRAWVDDASRFKSWIAARQIGKSMASACEAVRDCLVHPGSHWVILSAGRDQALEWMRKASAWSRAFGVATGDGEYHADELRAEISWPNGSRVTALAANPATARGYSAHVILDEFAIHQDATEIWRAIYPSISNPLKGELKLRVLSTPKGLGNKFAEIVLGNDKHWSRHRTTIHDAIAAGLKIDLEALRAQAGDADTWAQEFECRFIDGGRRAFSHEMIAACESDESSVDWPVGHVAEGPLYVGIDVGSIHDPTVCVTVERVAGVYIVRQVLTARGIDLADQDAILDPAIVRAARGSGDASGIGLDLMQRLTRRHGGKMIARVTTSKWKREAMSRLQVMMGERAIALPRDRAIREDLHAYEVHGAGETASYHAPRTDDGHSDFTSALAHAIAAATDTAAGSFDAVSASGVQLGGGRVIIPRFSPARL